jgi:hypothetical protein
MFTVTGASQNVESHATTGLKSSDDAPAVRFASSVEEIAADDDGVHPQVSPEQLKQFTKALQGTPLQERRMNTYQFEPFSLPPSRVC